jgi:hypothetical protein
MHSWNLDGTKGDINIILKVGAARRKKAQPPSKEFPCPGKNKEVEKPVRVPGSTFSV